LLSTLRRRLLRPWAILPLALVVGGSAWFVSRPSDEGGGSTTTQQTAEVSTGTMSQTVSASGTIEAAATDELSFSAAGTVTAVNVEAGAEVQAGDVLATLDSPELVSAVDQAEATVADAEARLDEDQDADASGTQIAADESSLESAQRQLDAANEALAGTQLVATIDGTVSAVDLTVGEELGDAGTSGTGMTGSATGSGQSSSSIGSGDGGQGALSGGGTDDTSSDTSAAQIEVVSTGSYLVELGIDDTEIDQVAEGQEAELRLSSAASTGFPGGGFPGGGAFPGGGFPGGGGQGSDDQGADESSGDDGGSDQTAADPFAGADEPDATGSVTSVGAIADASSGVASYPVEVSFDGSVDDFHVGATVDVEIVYEQVEDALQVPSQYVTTTQGASTVVVVRGNDRETRTVETGITSGGMVQITSGLQEGEQVLLTITVGGGGGFAGGGPGAGDTGDDDDGGGGGGGGFTPPAGFGPGGGG
jgi:macrolide-specific efflux system membrane fusion protein